MISIYTYTNLFRIQNSSEQNFQSDSHNKPLIYSVIVASMRSSYSHGWADIETLRVIFNYCFPFVEKLKFKSVCRSWRAIAESELKLLVNQSNPPCLFFQRADDNFPASGYGYGPMNRNSCKILNLETNEYLAAPPPPRNKWVMPESSHIVGSCRGGWLLLMKKTSTSSSLLSLWNPRFDVQIRLPDCVRSRASGDDHWITKAALVGSEDPLVNSTEYGVVIMYGDGNLAFAKQGDSCWSKLGDEEGKCYLDVTSFGNSIIALSYCDQLDHQIDVWKFISNTNTNTNDNNTYPDEVAVVRTMKTRVSHPSATGENIPEAENPLNYKYSSQMYIVREEGEEEEGGGRVLLVVRWIGNFVDENGKLWTEDEIIEEEDDQIVDCAYRTLNFYVFELDTENKKWVRVNNLGNNQVLFVGGNEAVSWHASNTSDDESSCILKNSIYFTDDCWDRMEEHEYYGGHDMGIFTLEDGNIHQIFPFYLNKISPPFWLLP